MKKIILVISFLFLSVSVGVGADVVQNKPWPFTYLFHLYYDKGQLFADRDFKLSYDLISEEYISESPATQYPYQGEIINYKNEVASKFLFDPRQGNPKFLKGKVSIKALYTADALKVIFYDAQHNSLLTIPLTSTSVCNDNGLCDAGEDANNCLADCRASPEPATPSPTTLPVSGVNNFFGSILYIIGGIGLIAVLWIGQEILKRRNQDGDNGIPPPAV